MNENGYLELMQDVIKNGYDKPNRTTQPTRSISGAMISFELFDLSNDKSRMILPLLTTKFVSFKLVASELLWFLSGNTDSTVLAQKYNNHIWDNNGSREFLDSRGFLFRDEGDLGPVYGFQWRHWNGEYIEKQKRANGGQNFSPQNPGIDQIRNVIESIKKDPWSRRHMVLSWNPEQLESMALPPCHLLFQFIVRPFDSDRNNPYWIDQIKPYWIDLVWYQRSADLPLGVPFNIASYALLLHMIAHHTNLHAGKLIGQLADVHIYHNQINLCHEQLSRKPYDFPTIEFISPPDNIDDWTLDNFKLCDYNHHPTIKFPFTT